MISRCGCVKHYSTSMKKDSGRAGQVQESLDTRVQEPLNTRSIWFYGITYEKLRSLVSSSTGQQEEENGKHEISFQFFGMFQPRWKENLSKIKMCLRIIILFNHLTSYTDTGGRQLLDLFGECSLSSAAIDRSFIRFLSDCERVLEAARGIGSFSTNLCCSMFRQCPETSPPS